MSILDKILGRRVINGDMTGRDVVGRRNNGMGTIQVNGRTFTGSNISMSGGRIIVDGEDVTDATGIDTSMVLDIRVTGDIENVFCDRNLTVVGNVKEYVDAKGSVSCNDVGGDVRAGGAVNCDDVRGNVTANGSVNCDDVGGSVKAGGSVNRS